MPAMKTPASSDAQPGESKLKKFWPCVLRTDPPVLLTEQEALEKVPHMRVTHIPATHPNEEHP